MKKIKNNSRPIEEETDDFPDEYGLDAHNASDYLSNASQCKDLIQNLFSNACSTVTSDGI